MTARHPFLLGRVQMLVKPPFWTLKKRSRPKQEKKGKQIGGGIVNCPNYDLRIFTGEIGPWGARILDKPTLLTGPPSDNLTPLGVGNGGFWIIFFAVYSSHDPGAFMLAAVATLAVLLAGVAFVEGAFFDLGPWWSLLE